MKPKDCNCHFRGALLRLDKDKGDIVFPHIVIWDGTKYDTDEFFDPDLPTQLTIPKGVRKIRLYAGIELCSVTDSPHSTFVNFRKNDQSFHGNPASNVRQGVEGWGKNVYTLSSPPIEVKLGDVFELRINTSLSDNQPNTILSSPTSYMAVEVVEYVPI